MDADTIRQILRDAPLASLGDAYVNFVYSLALTEVTGHPQSLKVSDRTLAKAFRNAGLRELLGTRVTRKDLANACEALLVEAYRKGELTINESVRTITQNPEDLTIGLSHLLKLAAHRVSHK